MVSTLVTMQGVVLHERSRTLSQHGRARYSQTVDSATGIIGLVVAISTVPQRLYPVPLLLIPQYFSNRPLSTNFPRCLCLLPLPQYEIYTSPPSPLTGGLTVKFVAQLGSDGVGADWKVDLYDFVETDGWINIGDLTGGELPTTPSIFLLSI